MFFSNFEYDLRTFGRTASSNSLRMLRSLIEYSPEKASSRFGHLTVERDRAFVNSAEFDSPTQKSIYAQLVGFLGIFHSQKERLKGGRGNE